MAGADFTTAARSLSLPVDGPNNDEGPTLPHRTSEPRWHRRSISSATGESRPRTIRDKWLQSAEQWHRWGMRTWYNFTPLQRAGLIVLNIVLIVTTVLFLIYNERIFAWLSPAAEKWRNLPAGWLILWVMTFFVSFPPMIGYSTCVTIAGFVFGMKGWFIVSTATVVGSTCSFIASRSVLRSFVSRLTEKNKQFAALSLVLKHDGLKLLIMIRLCPLPYSLSNGAISTIPTVSWQNFAIATAIASPRLLLHVFVGSRLGDLAENGDKMDTKAKIVSYIGIAIGVMAGIGTGYFVYVRTKARAQQLEAEEAAGVIPRRRTSSSARQEFADDPEDRESTNFVRRDQDDISLHQPYDDYDHDLEGGAVGGYRDEFTDDEDARERDVFDDGDGDIFGDEEDGIESKVGGKAER